MTDRTQILSADADAERKAHRDGRHRDIGYWFPLCSECRELLEVAA